MPQVLLHSPLDMHLHLREGAMLETVTPLSAQAFAGAVIMPNLVPPVQSRERLEQYRAAIQAACAGSPFTPYMTLFFTAYDERTLQELHAEIIGIKLYPAGVTTNSATGVQAIEDAASTLAIMQELHIPLLVHGETHGFVLDREREFLAVYDWLATHFPRLTIVMEHITTREAVTMLDRYANLYATVTLHHLLYTLDDVAGGLLQPHLFCKPLAKRPEDRDALLAAALSAHPKLMFGSDSAPHPQSQKECSGCAAGVFTAPIALPRLVELFEQHHALPHLQAFVSDNAQRIYQIQPPARVVQLDKTPWVVPERYGAVIPMQAGDTLAWRVCPS
ncbi:MAG: dihydroorotase [Candidatus Tectomicrobia bacterium]|uniref:Dihydroorotase n=1 Tax=Tectimicrobiota bacterium TaxID=2528274 RepID=A0A938B3E3_UNCTE|nr:dihydroorotase [Candidatus Tectomicrobia bacterium]